MENIYLRITKNSPLKIFNLRRISPQIKVNVKGLEPYSKYVFLIDMIPADDNKYKHFDSNWVVIGKADPLLSER